MNITGRILGGLLVGLALQLSALAALALAGAASDSLRVQGAVKTLLTLSTADAAGFPADQIVSVTLTRSLDVREGATTARGVRLSSVFERAGLLAPGRSSWKSMVVLATASDGYKVAFSWPELSNTAVGEGVLVLFERDGQPLAQDEGSIAPYSARDLHTEARHVRWLSRTELRQL